MPFGSVASVHNWDRVGVRVPFLPFACAGRLVQERFAAVRSRETVAAHTVPSIC